MSYIDGFVIPVKSTDKAAFVEHAKRMDKFFIDNGATRVIEAWGEDVPHGKVTDFHRAVAAVEGETVAFSWIEWPDKATRDRAMKVIEADAKLMSEPMPFDGKRMIFGGFEAIVTLEK